MNTLCAKPNAWTIYNIPHVQPVSYSSILNNRNEFSSFIQECRSQGLLYDEIHCCKILSSMSSFEEQSIYVTIFNGFQEKSKLCFKINFPKSDIRDEFNKVLIFIKRLNYEISYLVFDENFYLRSKLTEHWNLFYDLYNLLLNAPVTTVLGTQFYFTLACSNLIYNEFMWLRICSSVIKSSETSSICSRAHLRHLCDISGLRINTENNFSVVCTTSTEKKSFEFKTVVKSNVLKTSPKKCIYANIPFNSTKRKLINICNQTVKHETQLKRKRTDRNPHFLHQDVMEKETWGQLFTQNSCDISLKRKRVGMECCASEIPLKQSKIKEPSSNSEISEKSFAAHTKNDASEQSLCKYSKWKIFSHFKPVSPVNYVDLLLKKCYQGAHNSMSKKSPSQFLEASSSPQQVVDNFKCSQNNKLNIVSSHLLTEPRICDLKTKPLLQHVSINNWNNSFVSPIRKRHELSIRLNSSSSMNDFKEIAQIQSEFPNVHAEVVNEINIPPLSFNTEDGKTVACAESDFFATKQKLEKILDENKKEPFNPNVVQNSNSSIVLGGDNLSTSAVAFCINKDDNETQVEVVLAETNVTKEFCDEKNGEVFSKMVENDMKPSSGEKSPAVYTIKCSDSSLIAQNVFKKAFDEESKDKKEFNFNVPQNSKCKFVQSGNNSSDFLKDKDVIQMQKDIALEEKNCTKEYFVDEEDADIPPKLKEKSYESFTGFKSASGHAINISESALLAAQKMLKSVSNESEKFKYKSFNRSMNMKNISATGVTAGKCSKFSSFSPQEVLKSSTLKEKTTNLNVTHTSNGNLDESANPNATGLQKNQDDDETQMDVAFSENFFTEECFDEESADLPPTVEESIQFLTNLKSAGANERKYLQSNLLTSPSMLENISNKNDKHEKGLLNFNTSKTSNGNLAENINLNHSSVMFCKNQEVDETQMDTILAENFFTDGFDEKDVEHPPSAKENSLKPLSGFRSAGGNAIKCSQSALLAAQKILGSVSDENDKCNEKIFRCNASGLGKSNLPPSGNEFNQNSVNFINKDIEMQLEILLKERISAEKCVVEKRADLPSTVNVNSMEPMSGFRSAGGTAINGLQSAFMATQKMLEFVSDENTEWEEKILHSNTSKKSNNNLLQSGSSRNQNSINFPKNKDIDKIQMDFALPETFFTEECFDEKDAVLLSQNDSESLSVLFQSGDPSTFDNLSKKQRKTLGTRRSLQILPKKDET